MRRGGSAFWSQRYGEWAEIEPPRTTPTFVNPTQQLDWRRFLSDSWLACFDGYRHLYLRLFAPGVLILIL